MYIILLYDIAADENGARVSRNVFKTCKKYLVHVQKSVFEGEISEAKLFRLEKELAAYIRKDSDSVIIFKSRSGKWLEKEFLGTEPERPTNFF